MERIYSAANQSVKSFAVLILIIMERIYSQDSMGVRHPRVVILIIMERIYSFTLREKSGSTSCNPYYNGKDIQF